MDKDKKCLKIDNKYLNKYIKRRTILHYCSSLELGEPGSTTYIQTIEGMVKITIGDDLYIMFGNDNDIYPITSSVFKKRYMPIYDDMNIINECLESFIKSYHISSSAIHACLLKTEVYVFAKKINHPFCVYEKNTDSILYGKAGDYYVVAEEDMDNIYIIENSIMEKTYEIVK